MINNESVFNNIHCTPLSFKIAYLFWQLAMTFFISEVPPAPESNHNYPVFVLHKGQFQLLLNVYLFPEMFHSLLLGKMFPNF